MTVVLFFRQEMVEIKILLGCCIPRIIIKYRGGLISYRNKLDVGNRMDFWALRLIRGQITQSYERNRAER